jgi:hypothetical protein
MYNRLSHKITGCNDQVLIRNMYFTNKKQLIIKHHHCLYFS